MSVVQQEIRLNAAADRVWSFVVAPRCFPAWIDDIQMVQNFSASEIAPGTRFEIVRKRGRDPEAWIVAEWEPGQRVRYTAFYLDHQMIFDVRPDGSGSALTMRLEQAESGLFARFVTIPARQAIVARSLANLNNTIIFNRDIMLLHGMGDE